MLKLTPRTRVLFVRRLFPAFFAILGIFAFLLVGNLRSPKLVYASAADTVNFQARLQAKGGAIAPDGYYDVEFKLYDEPSGDSSTPGSCTGDSHCLWHEDYTGSNAIEVKDGYLSTQLGSIDPFPSSIDWGEQLYLTMDIGGNGSSPSWDGEMAPRLALTATPYAFLASQANQASELSTTDGNNTSELSIQGSTHGNQIFTIQDQGAAGTYNLLTTSQANSDYIQLQSGTPTQQSGELDISGAATVGSIETESIDSASSGTITIGGTDASGIILGNSTSNIATTINGTAVVKPTSGHNTTTAFQVQSADSSTPILDVDTSNARVGINMNNPSYTLDVNGVINSNNSIDVNGLAVCTSSCTPSSGSGSYLQNSTTVQTSANFFIRSASASSTVGILQGASGQTADLLDLQAWNGTSSTTVDQFNATGGLTINNTSSDAFQVQNTSGSALLTADTSNAAIVLGQDGNPTGIIVRGGTASGTNTSGSNITFQASDGTGAGGSGSFLFQTAKPATATPTLDNSAQQGYTSACSTVNYTYTTGSQSNRLMVVELETGSGETFTSVSYNASSLTQLSTKDSPGTQGLAAHIEVWYLLNPSSGSHTLSFTLSGNSYVCGVGVATFYNVNQSTPFGTVATANGTTSPGSQATSDTITANTTQLVVDAIGANGSNNLNNGVSQTQLWYEPYSGGSYGFGGADQPGTGSTVTMSWNINTADWADIAFPINATGSINADTMSTSLAITSAGNVGIDNASPSYSLDVSGTTRIQSAANSSTAFQVENASGTNLLAVDTSGDIVNVGATGSSTLASTVNIATSSSTTSTQTVTIGSDSDTANAITIDGGTGTAAIQIGNSNSNHGIQIGTGTGTQTVTLGSTSSSSTTTIQGGTGGVTLTTGPSSGSTGTISITTGNSSAGLAGNVTIDTGSSAPAGTIAASFSFESSVQNMAPYAGSGTSCNQSGVEAYSGTYSLAVTGGSSPSCLVTSGNGFSVTAGHKYYVTGWVHGGSLADVTDSGLEWSNSTWSFSPNVTDSISGWTEISFTATAPSGVTSAQFYVGTQAGASETDYFDDFTVMDVSSASGSTINIGGTNAQSVTIGSDTSFGVTDIVGGGGVQLSSGSIGVSVANGGVTIQPQMDSTTVFQVNNAEGANILTTNTSSGYVTIGSGPNGENNPILLVLDNGTNSGAEPTEVNGGMYYDTTVGAFRCGEGGIWVSCVALNNASTSSQTVTTTTTAYLNGSAIHIPASGLHAGTQFTWRIALTKTASGTATPSFTIEYGTNGTTSDTSEVTFTGPAESNVADTAYVTINVTVQSVDSSAGAWSGSMTMIHNNTTSSGFIDTASSAFVSDTTTSPFNDTTSGAIVGIAVTAGSGNTFTVQQVQTNTADL